MHITFSKFELTAKIQLFFHFDNHCANLIFVSNHSTLNHKLLTHHFVKYEIHCTFADI